MHLRTVKLTNWRSYRDATFEFPRPLGDKNVVLIMAPNEYGKTSFFEAVTLGLFGRDGLSLSPRARPEDGRVSYSKFLESILHKRALEVDSPTCSVELSWEDENGEPIEINRRWHFRTNSGSHRTDDDEIIIYQGHEREPIELPALVKDREEWTRDYIVQKFLAPHLAEFFLFDGEKVQRYANREMRDQIRLGVEGLLGLPVLKDLRESLGNYARERRKRVPAPSDSTVKGVEHRIQELEKKISEEETRLHQADTDLASISDEYNDLSRLLDGRGEGTVALLKTLLEEAERCDSEADKEFAKLTDLLAGDVALAVAGMELRENTIKRLESEEARQEWETARNQGSLHLDRFAADLSVRIAGFKPSMPDAHRQGVVTAARAAWNALWYPPPEGCAGDYLHRALAGSAVRSRTIERLQSVGRRAANDVSETVRRFHTASDRATAKRREAHRLEQLAPSIETWATRLSELSGLRGRYIAEQDAASRAMKAAKAELNDKRAELGRYISQLGPSAPELSYAQFADAYAGLVNELLDIAVPHEVEEVAREMTAVWKSMAHHSDRVDRIEISPNCEVRMLAANGTDLHEIEKSAGANQIFTQALIAALTKVSKRTFPVIVDTPLARLSLEQRLGVLRTFTDRPGQVILLSTDQEVVDDKLDVIRHRIAASFELKLAPDGGIAVTTIHRTEISPEGEHDTRSL